MTTTLHRRSSAHLAYEDDIRRWRDLGERVRERYGKPTHVSDRDALGVLAAKGILPADHGIEPRDVYAFLSPTREGARLGLVINRLGPWQHPGWGPVNVDGGWLYVLDLRPSVEWHRQRNAAGESTCDCLRSRP